MSRDLLKALLWQLDISSGGSLIHDEVAGAKDELEALEETGMLVSSFPGDTVVCNECGETCHREVECFYHNDGTVRAAIAYCDRKADVPPAAPVALERLHYWRVVTERFVSLVSEMLGVGGPAEELVRKNLWRLGALRSAGRRADVFLLLGSQSSESGRIWRTASRAMSSCSQPVLLTPLGITLPKSLAPRCRSLSLSTLLSLSREGLSLDVEEIHHIIAEDQILQADAGSSLVHSPDFASASVGHASYKLTAQQRKVIETLHDAKLSGAPWVSGSYLLEQVLETGSNRLRDTFRRNPRAWSDLIESDRKGSYRLKV